MEKTIAAVAPFVLAFVTNAQADDDTVVDVRVDEDGLDIAYALSADEDVVMRFEKCMFNDLMSFSLVSLRNNLTGESHILNKTYSDNIGPVQVAGSCYVGGNHSYNNNEVTRTAATVGYSFYADGMKLRAGDSGRFNTVTVEVDNLVFDPRDYGESEDGGVPSSLSSPLYSEKVIYNVTGANIEVDVAIEFLKDVTISNYYGMQSMCNEETAILTPNGAYADWTEPRTSLFAKADFPNFRTIVERTSDVCQSSFLYDEGIGDHSYVIDDSFIFNYGSEKSYHHLFSYRHLKADGTAYRWHGLYTWCKPMVDDEDVLIYDAADRSGRLLFVTAKRGFSGEKILDKYSGKVFSIDMLQDVDGISVEPLPGSIHVEAMSQGGVVARMNDIRSTVESIPVDANKTEVKCLDGGG